MPPGCAHGCLSLKNLFHIIAKNPLNLLGSINFTRAQTYCIKYNIAYWLPPYQDTACMMRDGAVGLVHATLQLTQPNRCTVIGRQCRLPTRSNGRDCMSYETLRSLCTLASKADVVSRFTPTATALPYPSSQRLCMRFLNMDSVTLMKAPGVVLLNQLPRLVTKQKTENTPSHHLNYSDSYPGRLDSLQVISY